MVHRPLYRLDSSILASLSCTLIIHVKGKGIASAGDKLCFVYKCVKRIIKGSRLVIIQSKLYRLYLCYSDVYTHLSIKLIELCHWQHAYILSKEAILLV